ncbi:hypothetical protein IWQ61_003300 [Dispira simplex]|nr:hypothetical protein IWQ61_003300 [Dispira simplex]
MAGGAFAAWLRQHNLVSMFAVAQRPLTLSVKRMVILNRAHWGCQQRKRAVFTTRKAFQFATSPYPSLPSFSQVGQPPRFPFHKLEQYARNTGDRSVGVGCRLALTATKLIRLTIRNVIRFWMGRYQPSPRSSTLRAFRRADWWQRPQGCLWFSGLPHTGPWGFSRSMGNCARAFSFGASCSFRPAGLRSFSTTNTFFTPSYLASLAQVSRPSPTHAWAALGCQADALCHLQTQLNQRRLCSSLPRPHQEGTIFVSPKPVTLVRRVSSYGQPQSASPKSPLTRLAQAQRRGLSGSVLAKARAITHYRETEPMLLSSHFEPVRVSLEIAIQSPQSTQVWASPPVSPKRSTGSTQTVLNKLQRMEKAQRAHLLTVTRMVEQLAECLPCQVTHTESHIVVHFPTGMARRQVHRLLRRMGIDPDERYLAIQEHPVAPRMPRQGKTFVAPLLSPFPLPQLPHLDLAQSVFSSTESSYDESWGEASVPTVLLDDYLSTDMEISGYMDELDCLIQDNYVFGPQKKLVQGCSPTQSSSC